MLYAAAILFLLALIFGVIEFGGFEFANAGITGYSSFLFLIGLALVLTVYFSKRIGKGPRI